MIRVTLNETVDGWIVWFQHMGQGDPQVLADFTPHTLYRIFEMMCHDDWSGEFVFQTLRNGVKLFRLSLDNEPDNIKELSGP